MTKSTNNIDVDVSMNGQKLEVTSFKNVRATLCKNGTCSAEIRVRFASAMAAVARLSRIWRCNSTSFKSKFKLYNSLVTCILLCGCETWTLLAYSEKRDPGFRNQLPEETPPYLLLGAQVQRPFAGQDQRPREFIGTSSVKRRKLAWFGHVTRHDSLSQTDLHGTLEGGQHRGRQRKCWMGNIKEWTSLPLPELLKCPPAENSGRGSLLNRPLCPPDNRIGQRTELN